MEKTVMSDEIETIGKVADATKEVANTGGKAIDAASGTGQFFKEVFGDLVVDGVGLLADKLKYYRIERAILLAEKTQERLQERGVTETRALPPKVAIPLIENATIEGDDNLHTLWSNLLATAIDPSKEEIQKKFVTILGELSPYEAEKLQELMELGLKFGRGLDKFEATQKNYIPEQDDAWRTLMRLGLIKPVIAKLNVGDGLSGPSDPLPLNYDTEKIKLTRFGISFVNATSATK